LNGRAATAAPGAPFVAVALCRAGFEAEATADLACAAVRAGLRSAATAARGAGYAALHMEDFDARRWHRALIEVPPVFARTCFAGTGTHRLLADGAAGRADRVAPLIEAVAALPDAAFSTVWVEFPDTNEGKSLSTLARALEPRLASALAQRGMRDDAAPRLHVFLLDGSAAYVGASDPRTGSPWPMGIPRLRMPHGAPSRSTLKLAEAFAVFLGEREPALLRPGLHAVDLGAAPGGWTWQLARRGLRVTAVDNGALQGDVAADPRVTHLREDGLKWRPRRPVDWLVCDIVDQPRRVAALVADWIAEGAARRAIFNLKLPMKKRYDEVTRAQATIAEYLTRGGIPFKLRFRQLYHDREEVTGYVERTADRLREEGNR
jgi:23S rRNA (cytidine2498-2'-O)-methyltransferase